MFQNHGNRDSDTRSALRPAIPSQAIFVIVALLGIPRALPAEELPRVSRELLRLVPPRACVILTVDDLRGQVRELMASRFMADLQALPVVKAWFESEKYRELESSRDRIEEAFRTSLTEIRDKVLGDAVLFALDVPPEAVADPSKARGLLILKASDPALLQRLIDTLNTIQKTNREVTDIEERSYLGQSYFARKFPEGPSRRVDLYVAFPDGTFAISNSAEIIHEVIARKSSRPAESAGPTLDRSGVASFLALQRRLPDRAVARLFVDPRMVSRLLKNAQASGSPGRALVMQHVAALESAGAALIVRDGRITLHVAEVYPKASFQGSSEDVATFGARSLEHFPTPALAAGSLQVDFPALYQGLVQLVPEKDRPRLESIEAVLRGILLGQEFRSRVLPALGPRVAAYVEAPADWKSMAEEGQVVIPGGNIPFPVVMVVELNEAEDPGKVSVAAAIDNALSTLLAVITLDERHQRGRFRVASREYHGFFIKTIEPAVPFAFTVDPKGRRLILGNSPAAVERFLAGRLRGDVSARWLDLKATAFPDAQSFLCLDLAAVHAMIRDHRDAIADLISRREHRSRDDVARDLENAASLAELFDAAFWAGQTDPKTATAFHTVGLVPRQRAAASGSSPRP
jgi:hypothetical protein